MKRTIPTIALVIVVAGCPAPEQEAGMEPGLEPLPELETEQSRAPAPTATTLDPAELGPEEHVLWPVGEIEWQAGPASVPEGAEFAVLEGDPADKGIFVMRLRLPDGYRLPPHWHPNFERVTVLEGTFHLGTGEAFDETATTALHAGSFTVMPPETRHFAHFEGETVIQITSAGPWELNYVNPEDDPRR